MDRNTSGRVPVRSTLNLLQRPHKLTILLCRVGEFCAGILVGNLLVLPRFFITFKAKVLGRSTSYYQPQSSRHGDSTRQRKDSELHHLETFKQKDGGTIQDNTREVGDRPPSEDMVPFARRSISAATKASQRYTEGSVSTENNG